MILEGRVEYNSRPNMWKILGEYLSSKNTQSPQNIYNNNYSLQALNKFARGDNSTLTSVPTNMSNEYKQAIYNKEWERRHPEIANRIVDIMNTETYYANNQPLHKVLKAIGFAKDTSNTTLDEYLKQAISYENYNPVVLNGVEMVGSAPTAKFGNMAKAIFRADPSYNAQNTVGRADYEIDNNGNVILKDRYNINKGLHMGNALADIIHTWAKHQPNNAYDVRLNLGNINDWNLQYTGNDYLREIAPDRSNLMNQGIYERGYSQ